MRRSKVWLVERCGSMPKRPRPMRLQLAVNQCNRCSVCRVPRIGTGRLTRARCQRYSQVIDAATTRCGMSKKFPELKVPPCKSISPPVFQRVIRGACRYGRIQAAARKSARCWVSGSPVRSFSVHVPHIEAVVHDPAPPNIAPICRNVWKDGRMSAPRPPVCLRPASDAPGA